MARKAIINDLFEAGLISQAQASSLSASDTPLVIIEAQGAAVADASGGATVDAEARTAINTLLARLRAQGVIAT